MNSFIDALFSPEWNGVRVLFLAVGLAAATWAALGFPLPRRSPDDGNPLCLDCHHAERPRPGCCVEPSDADLAAQGVMVEPTDPFDQESYK